MYGLPLSLWFEKMVKKTLNYKRLVIVDPQLKDKKGHNYRYARGIASKLGLPAVVLSHGAFSDGENAGFDVQPVLSFDQYNNSVFKEGFKPSFFERVLRYQKHLSIKIGQANGIWEQDSPLGLTLVFLMKILSALMFVPALIMQIKTLITGRGSSAHVDTTALELKQAFELIKLGPGDLLVFQTMLWPTFESLLELRIQANGHFNCDALFIVHEDWLIYHTGFLRFSPARFEKRVLQALPFNKAKVVSTNQPLSDYCREWGGYFPAVVKEIEFPQVFNRPEMSKRSGRKRILIPGVYRGDKNFESVGVLVTEICRHHDGVEFCIHESVMARVALPSQYGDRFVVYSDIEGAEAWLTFLCSFHLILLPYGEAYRHRISGIIHEARLLNLPVICHQEIADASLLADTRCLYGSNGAGAAEAVGLCFEAGPDPSFFCGDYPNDISELLAEPTGWVASVNKPIAVQIKPAWSRCGTTVVLDAQLDYLVDRGYFVIEIYLKTEPWQMTADQVEFMWQVLRGGRQFSGGMAARVLLKDVRLFPFAAYLVKLLRRQIPAFFKRENIHGTWCAPDKALTEFLSRNKAEVVLVNHMFNADFAYKYIPAKNYICETHDIQINQLLRRRPELADNYDNELHYEMQVLQQFDAVVNLNKTEHKMIEAAVGTTARYIRPAIIRRCQNKVYASLTKLLEDQSNYEHIKEMPEKVDLLIMGDCHPANITSVQWFIDKVYPRLPEGTNLAIVGKVAMHLVNLDDKKNINIHPVGFLDQFSNLYDFCSLLILPDIMGDGIPIKTDEAIAHGIPFVATEHAFRGYSKEALEAAGAVPAKNAEQMGVQICTLLDSEQTRARVCTQSQKLIEGNGIDRYFDQWDKVIQELG